jgi:hypothetical protein
MGSDEELESLLQNALCRSNTMLPMGVELAVRMYANVVDLVVRKTGSQIIAAVVALRETNETAVPMHIWVEQVCQERDQAQVCELFVSARAIDYVRPRPRTGHRAARACSLFVYGVFFSAGAAGYSGISGHGQLCYEPIAFAESFRRTKC